MSAWASGAWAEGAWGGTVWAAGGVVPPDDDEPLEPVTSLEAFKHLRLDDGSDDYDPSAHPDYAMVLGQIAAAREWVENYTQRSVMSQQRQKVLRSFAGGTCGIELRYPPYIGPVVVTYYDEDNALQTLSSSNYYVDADSSVVPRLYFSNDFSAPSTFDRTNAVIVRWTAGYPGTGEDSDDVPQSIKRAVLIGVQLLYDDLQPDKRTALENARKSLVDPLRIYSL